MLTDSNQNIFVLFGMTGIGKSKVALWLAEKCGGEIINADSQQIYSNLIVGTASPNQEDKKQCPHHLYNFVDPKAENSTFSAGLWASLAKQKQNEILKKGKAPIFCGGTGFYLNSLFSELPEHPEIDKQLEQQITEQWDDLEIRKEFRNELQNLDPISHEKFHENDRFRNIKALLISRQGKAYSSYKIKKGPLDKKVIWLSIVTDRKLLRAKLEKRARLMIEGGLIEEVEWLKNQKGQIPINIKSIGYREGLEYLNGKITKQQLLDLIVKNTLAYAKRQKTWAQNQAFGKLLVIGA